jgi:hypothetical protein
VAAFLSMISQSNDGCEWLTYFRLLVPSAAAQLLGCFVLLDAGPYRLEGGGVRRVYIAAGLMDGGRWKSQRV